MSNPLSWLFSLSDETEEERKAYLRDRFTDSHCCPHCDEPIGGLGGWVEDIRPNEKGALIGNNGCPYCGESIWLTADNRVVKLND